MNKVLLYLFIFIIAGVPAYAQNPAFNVKELLTLKDHNSRFFDDYVTHKGYSYQKSKYDEKKKKYAYVLLSGIDHDLRKIVFAKEPKGTTITYGTTDSTDYQQLKAQLLLLQFRFVKYVPSQENGRSVLGMVYTDGNTRLKLYNSFIQDDDHAFVKYYRIKVM